jgi:biopolymer transport protein ExbB/TolQ
MNQTIRGAIALLVSVVSVHTLYEVLIRPGALIAQQAVDAGNTEALRSAFIILKDFEQEACLILMLWATYLVVEKILEITKTNFLFDVDFCKDTEMTKTGITDLVSELEKLKPSVKLSPLVRVLRASLRRFLVSNDVHSASEVVESEVAALVAKNEAGNSMIRYLIWAVPSIGFIGTVRGIGEALAKADEALAGNISGMTSSLGVAFNSTLVALFISIFLMFLLHQLQRLQDDLAVLVNAYLQEKVLDRLSAPEAI